MKKYARYSYWLETAGDLTPRPPLDGSITVDVAILGAGFTGLWTAYHLLEREPSLNVAVIEAEIAGFGASGRNGGWCYSGFPYPARQLHEKFGAEVTREILTQMYASVDDVGRVCTLEGIDAHFLKAGVTNVARDQHQLGGYRESFELYTSLGLEEHYQLLDRDGVDERLKVAGAIGGIRLKESATIQPARLARGLAEAVERHGGKVYEQTRVSDYTPGPPAPKLHTARGDVTAKAIVLAGEAYLAALPKLRRAIMPMTSHMVITEPLSETAWQEIGWEGREIVGGMGVTAGYLNKTVDGRIAFGAYRSVVPYGSKITDEINIHEDIFDHARRSTIDWFPAARGARFTHAWGGVFGIPRDRFPTMSYDRRSGVATGRGYTGSGVSTANLSGRILADLITERDTPITHLPMTTHVSRNWEPEPWRSLGAAAVRKSLERTERIAAQTGKYPDKPTLAQRIWRG